FGYLLEPNTQVPEGVTLPETAMFRTASVVKPITAAAVRQLAVEGWLGPSGLERRAFDLNSNGGVLYVNPFRGLTDGRHADITVHQLILHQGGFNRAADPPGDPMFKSRAIAQDMAFASPPSNFDTINWMLGQRLQWAPGLVSNLQPPNSATGMVAK